MRINVITIFPALFGPFMDCSIIARARQRGLLDITVHDLRDWTTDRHRTVDDSPYGGGPGMVMKPEPWFAALNDLAGEPTTQRREVVLLTPRGERLDQKIIEDLSTCDHLVMLCGRYEGFDDRVRQHWATREISLGDFVITGGELPAQVIIEGVTRLLPGALGDPESARQDSFADGLLDHRHYTRPPVFEGMSVPDVLLSGDHEAIRRWRLRDALHTTRQRRPDLLKARTLNAEEQELLDTAGEKIGSTEMSRETENSNE